MNSEARCSPEYGWVHSSSGQKQGIDFIEARSAGRIANQHCALRLTPRDSSSADREKPFTKSTLQLFRAHLLLHEKARLPFERSLQVAKKSGYLRSHGRLRAAVDSTYILGLGAVRDTYNLIGDGIVSVARILAKLSGKRLEA